MSSLRLVCRAVGRLLLPSLVAAALLGCTVIRGGGDDGGGGGGGGGGGDPPPPKVIDVLILTHIDPGAVNLADAYEGVVSFLGGALFAMNVQVRVAAMAPLYRRSGATVPLLYGAEDYESEFGSVSEAITYYAIDAGAALFTDAAAAESENLADLGAALETAGIYHPTSAEPWGSAYFLPPADGFLVITFSSVPRRCTPNAPACGIAGSAPAAFFTAESGGVAQWLNLPGDLGLPVSRIFHVAVVPEEGVDGQDFFTQCGSHPNFPQTLLDVIEPAPERYYGPLIEGIEDAGGRGAVIDLCEALSITGEITLARLAGAIAATL